jgi:hypothetical protein
MASIGISAGNPQEHLILTMTRYWSSDRRTDRTRQRRSLDRSTCSAGSVRRDCCSRRQRIPPHSRALESVTSCRSRYFLCCRCGRRRS